jgi:hypothetical protein
MVEHGWKWTEGEIRRYLAEEDGQSALEVLQYILERGDRVIKRGDMSDPDRDLKLTEDD